VNQRGRRLLGKWYGARNSGSLETIAWTAAFKNLVVSLHVLGQIERSLYFFFGRKKDPLYWTESIRIPVLYNKQPQICWERESDMIVLCRSSKLIINGFSFLCSSVWLSYSYRAWGLAQSYSFWQRQQACLALHDAMPAAVLVAPNTPCKRYKMERLAVYRRASATRWKWAHLLLCFCSFLGAVLVRSCLLYSTPTYVKTQAPPLSPSLQASTAPTTTIRTASSTRAAYAETR
jgi:hypothetical protein